MKYQVVDTNQGLEELQVGPVGFEPTTERL